MTARPRSRKGKVHRGKRWGLAFQTGDAWELTNFLYDTRRDATMEILGLSDLGYRVVRVSWEEPPEPTPKRRSRRQTR